VSNGQDIQRPEPSADIQVILVKLNQPRTLDHIMPKNLFFDKTRGALQPVQTEQKSAEEIKKRRKKGKNKETKGNYNKF
jgi:hypothetical protein